MEEDENHFNVKTVDINGESIYIGGVNGSGNENIDRIVGNSFEDAGSNGDENLAPIAYGDTPKNTKKKKEVFNLENFYQFYEALRTYAGVYGDELEGPYEIQNIENSKYKTMKSKSITSWCRRQAKKIFVCRVYVW